MKRYIHSTSKLVHLSDIISKINFVIICDDINRTPCINASNDVPDGIDLTNEQSLIQLSDNQLMQLNEKDVHNFTNVELLNRLARLDIDKLTLSQIQYLKQANKQKYLISEEDVESVIKMLKKCKQISYSGSHWKTNKFALDEQGNFRKADCLNVIRNLTVHDYVASSHSDNNEFIGNNIIIFEPEVNWIGNNGLIFKNILVYVKLDIDETTESAIAIISFHSISNEDNKPYK